MMDSYYSGEMSAEDVQQKIKNICIDMRVEMVQQRYTNGYNAKDNQQILEDIYGFLQKINVNAAYAANEREGAEIAARHGGVDDYDWMYYNSDYYYKEEDMRNSVRQTIQEMSREWETEDVDFDKVEQSPDLTLFQRVLDYNKVWRRHHLRACDQHDGYSISIPPKTLFFLSVEKSSGLG